MTWVHGGTLLQPAPSLLQMEQARYRGDAANNEGPCPENPDKGTWWARYRGGKGGLKHNSTEPRGRGSLSSVSGVRRPIWHGKNELHHCASEVRSFSAKRARYRSRRFLHPQKSALGYLRHWCDPAPQKLSTCSSRSLRMFTARSGPAFLPHLLRQNVLNENAGQTRIHEDSSAMERSYRGNQLGIHRPFQQIARGPGSQCRS